MEIAFLNANALLKQIQAASARAKDEPIPTGFKSVTEWQKVWDVAQVTARRNCHIGAKLGLLERKEIRRVCGNCVRVISYYRPTGKKAG